MPWCKVNKAVPRAGAARPQLAKQEPTQYAQAWARPRALAYYNLLKDRFKAQILVPQAGAEVGRPRALTERYAVSRL